MQGFVSGAELLAALGIGLAGAGHCLGMCGGVSTALGLGGANATVSWSYQGGRLLSYTLLGALAGLLAGSLDFSAAGPTLRSLAGLLMIGMGLYIANWWHGIVLLERAGGWLWRPVQRWSSRLLPVRNGAQAAALGLCWGLLPCGLIYSSLAWSATAASPLGSALLMFTFGMGTLPAMLAVTLGAQRLQRFLRARGLKLAIAALLIAAGGWTLYGVLAHATGDHSTTSADHQHH